MARLRYKLHLSASSSDQEERDICNPTYEVYTDSMGEIGSAKYLIANGAALEPLAFPQVADAKFLLIRTSVKDPTATAASLDFRKNSPTGEVFTVAPFPGSAEGIFMMSTTGLTSLYVSNAGSDMYVQIVVAGD